MHQRDHVKLLNAGYTIIRASLPGEAKHIIKARTPDHQEWHILHKDFASMAARDRKMKELLLSDTIIED